MLLEFSVANFRSIKERQTFSMVYPCGEPNKERNIFNTGFKSAPYVLETTAIYGANASGKTNLLRAMLFFQEFVLYSSKMNYGDKINNDPFLFSDETKNAPSEFEIIFIYKNSIYQYGFTLDKDRVYEEWLYVTPKKSEKQKTQTWFVRDEKNVSESYVSDKEIKGAKQKWKNETKNNELFLSYATNRGNSKEFQKPYEWIVKKLRVIVTPKMPNEEYSAQQIINGRFKEKIPNFIQNIDPCIKGISVEEEEMPEDILKSLSKNYSKEFMSELPKKRFAVYGRHENEDGTFTDLGLQDESEGTRRLFAFSAPILDTLEQSYTLIVDELHNSLHPNVMDEIINMFLDKKHNKNNAQLIFTTHDTNSMRLLDKDQIWFTEKKQFGKTKLKALSEFKLRSNAFEKSYLSGRYGALPIIGDFINGEE